MTLRAGAPQPGTTYTTGTLVKLGIAIAGLGRTVRVIDLLYPATMWLALLVGSAIGAIARLHYGSVALLAPAALLLPVAAAHILALRRNA